MVETITSPPGIEATQGFWLWPMVEATHDGQANGEADSPACEDGSEAGRGVVPVLAVQDGRGHSEKPVH